MFEKLLERAERLARRRASKRAQQVADRLAAELPRGITAERQDGGVTVSGRGIARRFALDARLRWLIMGLIR